MTPIDIQKITKYWLTTSEKDLEVARFLFKQKYYPQSLFFCHLCLEKMLKYGFQKRKNKTAPFTHDLKRLAGLSGLALGKIQAEILDNISAFNISGRYVEDKFEFYKKYNRQDFAQKYLRTTESLIIWLKQEFQKKN